MAGNLFGSGDKTQSAEDNRIGLADAAQYAGLGALIFNRSAKADNISPALNSDQIQSFTPLIIVVAVVVGLVVVLYNRKS
jgi:hypothetical protein